MKVPVYSLSGDVVGEVELPAVFGAEVAPELIGRAFWALFTHSLQPKGTDPLAGERTSAKSWGADHGVARVARVKGSGYPRAGQAAGIAGVVGGRRPHPPTPEKNIYKRLNKKERRLAIASAIAATAVRDLVAARGHRVQAVPSIPLVVVDDLEAVSRAKDLRAFLAKLGLWEDVERAAGRSTRGGKASWRGRARRPGRGPLIVVSRDRGISKAAGSMPGVDVVLAKDLSVIHLAPGGHPGRLTVWTASALSSISRAVEEVAASHGP